MGIHEETENKFVDTLALVILEGGYSGNRDDLSEYKKGWLEGLGVAWTIMTGHNTYHLVAAANRAVAGSGKQLEM